MITESLHGIILLVAYTADMSIYPTGNLYWGKTHSITRIKTSIRYAKENDREKRERRRERERKVEG